MTQRLSIEDLNVAGKRVLVRVDFNVPLNKALEITDDTRIRTALPTISYLLESGASVILMSHLGRPKGEKKPEMSLAPCAKRLAELLKRPVKMASDCIGPDVKELADALQPGQVLLLENLRFHNAETKPEVDPSFAEQLAALGDVYVNDAFGSAHRAHSSTVAITRFFQDRAAGYLLLKEIEALGTMLQAPKRPFWAIIGGAKVSTKLGVLNSLSDKVDGIMIGGAMMFTLLKAQGHSIGSSMCEDELVPEMQSFLQQCADKGVELKLPSDIVIAQKISEDSKSQCVSTEKGIPEGWMGLDIGPDTLQYWSTLIAAAGTVLWNGPVGVFECPPFARGTLGLAHALADSQALSIVGGGDSLAAIKVAGVEESISHLSTGGGASLEYIENGTLPAIDALSTKVTSSS